MSSKPSRCHGSRKWESMMVVLKAPHRNDQLLKMHCAPFRTEPNCSTPWKWKAEWKKKTAIRRDFGLEWPASSNWIYHRSWLGWDISWLNTLNHRPCSEEESADWWHNSEKPEHFETGSLILGIFVAKVPEGETGVVLPCSSSSIWQGFRWRFKMMWCRLWLWYLDVLSKLAEDRESRPDRLLRTRIPLRDSWIVNYS